MCKKCKTDSFSKNSTVVPFNKYFTYVDGMKNYFLAKGGPGFGHTKMKKMELLLVDVHVGQI